MMIMVTTRQMISLPDPTNKSATPLSEQPCNLLFLNPLYFYTKKESNFKRKTPSSTPIGTSLVVVVQQQQRNTTVEELQGKFRFFSAHDHNPLDFHSYQLFIHSSSNLLNTKIYQFRYICFPQSFLQRTDGTTTTTKRTIIMMNNNRSSLVNVRQYERVFTLF